MRGENGGSSGPPAAGRGSGTGGARGGRGGRRSHPPTRPLSEQGGANAASHTRNRNTTSNGGATHNQPGPGASTGGDTPMHAGNVRGRGGGRGGAARGRGLGRGAATGGRSGGVAPLSPSRPAVPPTPATPVSPSRANGGIVTRITVDGLAALRTSTPPAQSSSNGVRGAKGGKVKGRGGGSGVSQGRAASAHPPHPTRSKKKGGGRGDDRNQSGAANAKPAKGTDGGKRGNAGGGAGGKGSGQGNGAAKKPPHQGNGGSAHADAPPSAHHQHLKGSVQKRAKASDPPQGNAAAKSKSKHQAKAQETAGKRVAEKGGKGGKKIGAKGQHKPPTPKTATFKCPSCDLAGVSWVEMVSHFKNPITTCPLADIAACRESPSPRKAPATNEGAPPSRDSLLAATAEVTAELIELAASVAERPPRDEGVVAPSTPVLRLPGRKEGVRAELEHLARSLGEVDGGEKWRGCELMPFGSSATDLGFDSADIDLNLQVDLDGSEAIEALAAAAEGSDAFTEVQAILSARVPILKLLHTATNVQCDVTVNRPISVHNSCLLKAYSELDSRVRPLILGVKQWSKRRNIANPREGTLSSYAWVNAVLFYLQQRRFRSEDGRSLVAILPNLQSPALLAKSRAAHKAESAADGGATAEGGDEGGAAAPQPVSPGAGPNYVDGHDVSFCHNVSRVAPLPQRAGGTVGELFMDFFAFYSREFNARSNVVAIRHTGPLKKSATEYASDGPMEWRISIEDPFDRTHDLGKVIWSPKVWRGVVAELKRARHLFVERARAIESSQQPNTLAAPAPTNAVAAAGDASAEDEETTQATFEQGGVPPEPSGAAAAAEDGNGEGSAKDPRANASALEPATLFGQICSAIPPAPPPVCGKCGAEITGFGRIKKALLKAEAKRRCIPCVEEAQRIADAQPKKYKCPTCEFQNGKWTPLLHHFLDPNASCPEASMEACRRNPAGAEAPAGEAEAEAGAPEPAVGGDESEVEYESEEAAGAPEPAVDGDVGEATHESEEPAGATKETVPAASGDDDAVITQASNE